MPDSDHTNLSRLLADLYDRKINCGIQTYQGHGMTLWISDKLHRRRAETHFDREHMGNAAAWLLAEAKRLYPDSFPSDSPAP